MSSGRFQHTLTFVTVIALWVSYGKYLFYLFENSRFFSHLSDTEREMTYRTEMGLYFSFYKALVSSNVTDWKNLLLRDNVTEYGHTINTLQRFNLYSEVLLALAYKSYKKVANYFDLNDQECWRINRGADLPPILSCEGIGNAHYFYVYMVFAVAGTVLPSVFICGTFFSGYIGGLVSTAAFFFNQGEATRVQWTPLLRESFAYPMFIAQTVVLTHILQCGRVSHFMAFAFTFFTTAFCVFWQLSPFIIGAQLGSLFFLYSLRLVPFPLFSSLWRLFSLSFLLSLAFLFGNLMLLNSLFFTSLFSIKMILLLRPFLRSPSLPLFFSLHLMLYLTGTFGIKFFLQSLFNITTDNHISDLVVAKFTGSHNFHTRLYTCAPEFDFLGFETIRKLIYSWLLPISFFAILLLIIKLTRTAIQLRNWQKIPTDSCHVKMHVEKLYNIVQLGCFVAMALLVMRLKLFATPHLCLLCSWAVNKDLLGNRLAPFRGILVVLLFSGMARQGWVNVSEQLEIKGEYNNPEQERLFHWIDKNTREDAVFAGTMALMANVKLSTLRPIFNHPHYESEEVRNRTLLVYSVYSRKSLSEVYSSLRSSGINYYVFQPQQCLEKHPKDGCSYLEMWDEHDPSNKGRPSLCHRIWEARKSGEQIGSFRPVYWSSNYIVLAL